MAYVPPHLRNTTLDSGTVQFTLLTTNSDCGNDQLNYQTRNPSDCFNSSFSSFSTSRNTARPNSGKLPSSQHVAVLEPVFVQWNPSERVRLLSPDQIEEIRSRLNVDVTSDPVSSPLPAPAPIESFADMCLHKSIMSDIAYHEYTRPTAIQAQAMPVALSGRDLLGCAETGSGKTAAFSIPMIQHCLAQPSIKRNVGPLALVLAPTRELAQQIEKEVKAFSRSLESFRTAIVVGGTNISDQKSDLRAGVHVVVATPGRFIDHLQQGSTSLSRVSFVVLDEADRMLDMGFEPQIREIMQNLPEKHQTLLFSATMPVEIEALAQDYLTNPVQVKVGKVSSPTANIAQILKKVPANEKVNQLLELLVHESNQADQSGNPFPLTIVFVERKNRCDEIAEALIAQGLRAVAFHGGCSQSEREAALQDFRKGSTSILVATDVASRGLDVTGVAHVINLDLPKTMEDYVHRIGRTGRAGSTGQATSFYTEYDTFLVAQIKKGISDAQSGNPVAFATGKVARQKEREVAAARKEDAKNAFSKLLNLTNVEDKYRHMTSPAMIRAEGAADGAWDD
ncbi:ATP-dependent RNA helicase DBP2-like [Impatiens glandulifera]|uniref:ATP-dependent RNA helicase DBP2-like n=1 Tax=Impatiens glandulifera TaxID=253017 RepID=UPI001FB188E9|nr:ATP-dependent RNA helicase DBP2-like [Impatiens glandulifera]